MRAMLHAVSDATRTLPPRYTVQRPLGLGRFGSVLLVTDHLLPGGTPVALTRLHPEVAADRGLVREFFRRLEATRRLAHPNLARTYSAGATAHCVYSTAEFVPGRSLAELRRGRPANSPVPVHFIAACAAQICAALGAIHAARLLHCELSARHVIGSVRGGVKVADLGAAYPADAPADARVRLWGTAEYMAPELWSRCVGPRGDPGPALTPAADLYAVGVILYALATGRLPFAASDLAHLAWMHLRQPPEPPARRRADLPAGLNQLIVSLLEKDPADQPRSADEVLAAVRGEQPAVTEPDVARRPDADRSCSRQEM